MKIRRRTLLAGGAAALVAAPFWRLSGRRAGASRRAAGRARRLIVFYFPDGVVGPSQDGEPSQWHPTGSGDTFTLPPQLTALERHREACVFFRGLSLGPTDSGSHPGGAKKLLTATDGGMGVSIDRHLAATVGADRPFRHLYLGAMANQNGASGDKHISYLAPGATAPPADDPAAEFQRLFGAGGGGSGGGQEGGAARALSILDTARSDLEDLRSRLGSSEKTKLDVHLESFRELEARLMGGGAGGSTCGDPFVDTGGLDGAALYDPARFPEVLSAQMDLMVLAMACDLTRVGVVQCSHHTSELIMSRFPATPMYDPGFDMRSHQASHYGPRHDDSKIEFRHFRMQVTWWVEQFASLLDRLAAREEDDGTMLDHSLVLLASEVSDGNTHSHDQMPFILAGRGGGAVSTGRVYDA
ncbi:MAG TPA: DUF1552 domain-containing protein, partial [Kofleriaceae bacterium]|nr:DUF1552 domain-containing protein [Kofleriaceae bacterium]